MRTFVSCELARATEAAKLNDDGSGTGCVDIIDKCGYSAVAQMQVVMERCVVSLPVFCCSPSFLSSNHFVL
jgi:hypothetical protein